MTTAVAFIGNCQAPGLSLAAGQLLPGSSVSGIHVSATNADEEIAARIADADVVVTGVRDAAPHARVLGRAALARPGRTVVYLPPFVFSGFHPDLTYLMIGRTAQTGPIGPYHSVLAAAAFVAGVPEQDVPHLYNAHVFARLGYLDSYAAARVAVVAGFAREGYDLEPALAAWLSVDRPFMLTSNHPAIRVLSSLATMALQRAGLVGADVEPPAEVHDRLADSVVAPAFPAIARTAGISGSTKFLRPIEPAQKPREREMSLADYVAHSFAIFRQLDPNLLDTRRIRLAVTALQAALGAARYPAPARSLASPASM